MDMIDRRIFFTVLAVGTVFGPASAASLDGVIAGLEWDDDSASVQSTLAEICGDVKVINAEPVQFPLAAHSEQHIVCSGMQLPTGEISSAVFVVADDALKMIEARDGAVKALVEPRSDEPVKYLSYHVFDRGQIFAAAEIDAVWLLSTQALHPNLFSWSNPFLTAPDAPAPIYNPSAVLPDVLALGADFETLKPLFEASCPIMNVEAQREAWLPLGAEQQTQVNCFSFEYAGFPRKFEAVFADGVLELVWILTAKQEEGRIREALIDAFGPSENNTQQNPEKWEIYHNGQIALRKDKPEILAISQKLVPYYANQSLPE